jgi:hypothetical protein
MKDLKLASTFMVLSRRRMPVALLCVPCLFVLAGCNRGPAMYQVRGHVFYKDGTVPRGGVAVVFFQPKPNSTAEVRKSASSPIKPDGSFEMWTRKAGDGVYQGDYDVGFNVIKAVMDSKSLIVDRYTRPQTSGYSVTVDHNIDDLKFEIEPLPGVAGAAPTTGG